MRLRKEDADAPPTSPMKRLTLKPRNATDYIHTESNMKRNSCRVLANEEPHHIVTIRGDRGEGSFVLVGPPARQYLSVHCEPGQSFTSISGRRTLVALAEAILRAEKRR